MSYPHQSTRVDCRLRFFASLGLVIAPVIFAGATAAPKPLHAKRHAELRYPSGYQITVDVADTPDDRETGLMYRRKLPKKYGMLFVFPTEQNLQFWMKNTYVPLDIVFIGADKKVTRVHANVAASTPLTTDAEVARAGGLGRYVLELPAGEAKRRGLKAGDALLFNVQIPER